VISRSREGLVPQHPYYRALCAAIEPLLKPLLDAIAEEEGAKRTEGEKLRNRFNALSNTLANKLQELLDASDSGEIPSEAEGEDTSLELGIIPPRRILRKGETVTLSLRAPESMDLSDLNIALVSGVGVIDILHFPDQSGWVKHPRLPALGNIIKIKGLTVGAAKIVVNCGDVGASCEATVIDFELPVEKIPDTLLFEPNTAHVAPEKRKALNLRAPIEYAGETVSLSVNDSLLEVQKLATLKPNSSGTFCETRVLALAGVREGSVVVTATLGAISAKVSVNITEVGHRRNPRLDFELSGRDNPPQRVSASVEDGRLIIRLYGKHRSLKNIFGSYTSNGFENENSPEASATISETLAQQLASYVVEREAEMHPERFSDAAMFFARQQHLVPHFAIALQAGLVNR